jgi:fluoride exporter
MGKWILLIAGGGVGTVARYALAAAVSQRLGTAFPWGTIAVNVAGCCAIGFLDVILDKKFLLNPNHRMLLIAGFCAAFTTFSSLILETSQLLKAQQFLHAFGNIMISLVAGFIAFKLGAAVAELF